MRLINQPNPQPKTIVEAIKSFLHIVQSSVGNILGRVVATMLQMLVFLASVIVVSIIFIYIVFFATLAILFNKTTNHTPK